MTQPNQYKFPSSRVKHNQRFLTFLLYLVRMMQNAVLSYTRKAVLSYTRTAVLSYTRTAVLSYTRTAVLSYTRTAVMSYTRTAVLSYTRTVKVLVRPYSRTRSSGSLLSNYMLFYFSGCFKWNNDVGIHVPHHCYVFVIKRENQMTTKIPKETNQFQS